MHDKRVQVYAFSNDNLFNKARGTINEVSNCVATITKNTQMLNS